MKHAYLIAAHNEFELLCELLKRLDKKDNDIYLHIDIKAKNVDYSDFISIIKDANIHTVKRRSVTWGGFSQIQLELDLLSEAVKNEHNYYHFISGVDFPIKSDVEFEDFFVKNQGREFIHFDRVTDINEIKYRIGVYHWFQEKTGRSEGVLPSIEKCLVKIQKMIGINRIDTSVYEYKKGANWFSITHELAQYVLSKRKEIQKMCKYSICADEIFLQTVVFNSKYRENLYYSENEGRCFNMRYVDWNRGNPYVFDENDYNELVNSECIFARKLNYEKSKQLVSKLQERVK